MRIQTPKPRTAGLGKHRTISHSTGNLKPSLLHPRHSSRQQPSRQDESQMEEEARSPSQAQEKKDEGSLQINVSPPQSQLPPQF
ncbi:hypothetical protein HBI25_064850 [Parastagonospora nodorum]|nr:hypothetical protein HBI09_073630 [Parastagonospora nodorum]KAH4052098.1 hypothetical protein HBH49_112010 [Parastagonospora nodorum]KAH4068038.1 hypothetical protein HBH50_121710 [Parastagonospora nodorum]KAH4085727.1 hypothetical protein HBH48_153450 [Parastagonospora nodorum]KAH4166921.1 hypothetical protein HBH43_130840 [Parastagonospora nodorum]